MHNLRFTIALIFLSQIAVAQSPLVDLQTVAESSEFQSTAKYDEVMEFCKALDKHSPRIHLTHFGESFEGRKLPLLVVSDPPLKTKEEVVNAGKVIVFVMANIHAGEVCGKEATLMLAREMALAESPGVLDKLIVLIAPIYNADGNERFSKENRRGQNGPANGMGQRPNLQNLDLNRDHIKLESPEARSLARLVIDWNPLVLVDTHTTNGSHHRYTITYDGPRNPATPGKIADYTRDTLLPAIGENMKVASGYLSFFYGNFDEPHQQWDSYPDWPRYSTHYFGLRGRIGILSEAYSYATYKDRVLATRQFVASILDEVHQRDDEILGLLVEANRALKPGASIAIRSEAIPMKKRFDILGYVEEQNDEGKWLATDEHRTYPAVRYLGDCRTTESVEAPFAYVVPAKLKNVLENLSGHGIEFEMLDADAEFDAEVYQVDKFEKSDREFQGHCNVSLEVSPVKSRYTAQSGDALVKLSPPNAALLVNLLEPRAQDGLASWNFLDDDLEEGKDYPIVRIIKRAGFDDAVGAKDVKPNVFVAAGSTGSQRITPEVWYGRKRPNLSGRALSVRRWIDDETVLARDGSKWIATNIITGESSEVKEHDGLKEETIALIPASHRSISRIHNSLRSGLLGDDTTELVSHGGDLFWVDLQRSPRIRQLTATPAEEQVAEVSGDKKWVAYVRDFNLYTQHLETGDEYQLTFDGTRVRRYGKADWVYYEEFYGRSWKGYKFSPDSRFIAFMHYDDSPVRDFNVINHSTPRTAVEIERYPKSGDPIPHVRLGVVPVTGGRVTWVDLSRYSPDNMILTRFGWYPDSNGVSVMVQDRAQKWLEFNKFDLADGKLTKLFRERSKYWVPDPGPLHFLDDDSFLVLSDQDGWRHIYRISPGGEEGTQLTKGEWEVREIVDVDEKGGWVYFLGARDSHLESHFYRVRLDDGSKVESLTHEPGRHRVKLSPDRKHFVDSYSALDHPTRVVVRAVDGEFERTLDENRVNALEKYALSPVELHHVELEGGYTMALTMQKPIDFNPKREYPVWMMTYGGPRGSSVSNSWNGMGRGYDQMLNELGIIAVHCDPRSASNQSAVNTWVAYQQLGVQETIDLDQAVDWLVKQGFVDKNRIGLAGHSYGGYLTAYAMTHSDKFAAGIAGAPVTDWRNYDAFYTERYMNTPQENPDGYDKASVLTAAENLHGRLLLLHGAMDDNVHVQNTLQLAQKLQNAGKQFEMMIYPTARHGIHGSHYNQIRLDFIRNAFGL